MFYKEIKKHKKSLIKNVNQQNQYCNTPPSKQAFIKLFPANQIHYNYELDQNILKTVIHRNILPTEPKKIKLFIL